MQYNIKGTAIELSPEVRTYLEKRLEHADRFLQAHPSAHLDVELEFSSGAAGPKFRTEFTVVRGKESFRAEATGSTLHESIDIASAELVSELARAKDKRMRIFRKSASRVKEYLRSWR